MSLRQPVRNINTTDPITTATAVSQRILVRHGRKPILAAAPVDEVNRTRAYGKKHDLGVPEIHLPENSMQTLGSDLARTARRIAGEVFNIWRKAYNTSQGTSANGIL